jgi:predicted RNase H-like HicB family nuclease
VRQQVACCRPYTSRQEGTKIREKIRMSELAADDRTITLTASLSPEEGGYVARCLELPVVTEGDTLEEAVAMLREAVELYLEDEPLPVRPSRPRFFTEFDITVPAA